MQKYGYKDKENEDSKRVFNFNNCDICYGIC